MATLMRTDWLREPGRPTRRPFGADGTLARRSVMSTGARPDGDLFVAADSPSATTAAAAGRHLIDQFGDLICADEELLRAEFDAIIAAEWPDEPPPPGRYRRTARPRRPSAKPASIGRAHAAGGRPTGYAGAHVRGWARSPPHPAEPHPTPEGR